MNEKTQYLVYKPKLKLYCLFQAIASGLSLIAIVLLIFLPQFKIDGLLLSYDFSVYDEVDLAFKAFKNTEDYVTSYFAVLQVIGVIFLAAGAVSSIVTLIKNVLNILSPDVYSVDLYDKIKRRADDSKKRRHYFSSTHLVMCGIIYEVLAIFMSVWVTNALSSAGVSDSYVASYFVYMTGVNGFVVLTLLVLIAMLVLYILAWRIKRSVRNAIIREDYNIGAENRTNDNTDVTPLN